MVNYRIQKRYTGRLWTRSAQPESRHQSPQKIFTIANHKLWQLDDPNLYIVTTIVALGAKPLIVKKTRFGFREFTARGKNFYLNGEKIILKTTFNEAFYPHALAYPTRPQSSQKRISAYQRRQHQHDSPVAQTSTANRL